MASFIRGWGVPEERILRPKPSLGLKAAARAYDGELRLFLKSGGRLTLDDAVPLDALERDPAEALRRLIPIEDVLPELPAVAVTEDDVRRVVHGNDIAVRAASSGEERLGVAAVRLVAPDGRLLAIARPAGGPGVLHPAVVLK